MTLSPGDLALRYRHHLERTAQYLGLGFDRQAAVRHVAGAASPLKGPVLDVGTGRGSLASELARRDLDVVTADPDPEAQELAAYIAQREGLDHRIWFLLADAASLPFDDGHFAGAFSMDALHHLGAAGPVLREMARVVASGGALVLADFTAAGFELVDRVHAAEGRRHPEGPVGLPAAREFLSGLGLELRSDSEAHFHRVLVFEKP